MHESSDEDEWIMEKASLEGGAFVAAGGFLADVKARTGWRNADEELPSFHGKYSPVMRLRCTGSDVLVRGCYTRYDGTWRDPDTDAVIWGVTHWRPDEQEEEQ